MKKLLLNSVLLTAGLGLYGEANAACSTSQDFRTVDVSMQVGRVVVRPSDPVGKVLVKSLFEIRPNDGTTYTCSRSDMMVARLLQNYAISPLGNNIYSTNIPGIGIRLYREAFNATNFSGYYPYTAPVPGTNIRLGEGYFVVEIVKTAENTGSGTLVPGQYSTYYAGNRSDRPFLTSTVYGNAITIASSSCEWRGNINKAVTLPTVTKSGFTGVGSTQGEQSFDLNILCNGGENPTGYEEKNLISLSFDYQTEGTNTQVLRNLEPNATKANGVGVQLLWNYNNQNRVIGLGDKLELGTVKSNQTIEYNVPLTARYYQTNANVTAGKVRAMATVTIEYD
ncbi:fimbrial protein [Acinetobacter lwoffii]|uniref:fimbrial protein n=1 Tax=Acinetobacter lwoffii TaxID=28090 RepID=UPI0012DD1C70|nr:fimbrial protein [Acinetobacter lwoffii]MCU4422485.1 fimbrial protein [Acinetobacter lwoffii]MCU4451219.1 fimbrial protein [Acinetobacter lwoffii]QGR73319.1 fimbrial protein [Acinetobacter lwoffii]QKT97350.1 type 1 fimbrial protein [Acinetobacter lwoffii]QZD34862.1 fimbrial adhesin precursor [Acinetobacter lwoffii]